MKTKPSRIMLMMFGLLFALTLGLGNAQPIRAQWTNATNINNTNSGNVGIGTTAPGAKLEVYAGASSSTDLLAAILSQAGENGTILNLNNAFGPLASIGATKKGGGSWADEGHLVFSTATNSSLSEKMRITETGNVGIGTASPLVKLHTKGPGFWESASLNGVSITPGATLQTIASDWNSGGSDTPLLIKTQGGGNQLYLATSGNVGIGTITPGYKLDVNGNTNVTGNVTVSGNISAKYQDVAEWVESSEQLSAGIVVVLDSTKSNQVISSSQPYDTRVAGVISAQPGIVLGEKGDRKVLVATTGRVKVRVDATKSPIQIGDLLVTSDTSGVAMKSEAVNLGGVQLHRPGTLIGKALEPLAKGKGEILVLLSLQ